MNQRDKETLMSLVTSGTLKEVKNAFKDRSLSDLFDNSYFDYKLLQASFRRNHQGIQNFLINKIGCRAGNPNKTEYEETPLHLAMKLDNYYIVRNLLRRGASIFAKNKNGETPLLVGFKNQNRIAVSALLNRSKLYYKPGAENAMLHFHIACAMNHIYAAELLLKGGVNPNEPFSLDSSEYSGLNPVQLAAMKDYYKLFIKLILHGGDLSIKDSKGLTPIHIIYYLSSAEERTYRIKEIFAIKNNTKYINAIDSNKVSHLHLGCMLDNVQLIQVYIDNGANINSSISLNSTVDPGYTPLHFAVLNGCDRVVELLLKNGAVCNKKNKEGKTPLHLASKISESTKKASIIETLFNFKADPAITDKQGYTPLHMEFYYGNSENKNIFDLLFSKLPKKINFTNNEGLSHFHIACATNNIKQVKDFLEAGVKIDSCVSSGIHNGYTALHFAAAYNHKDIVKLLLKKKALVNIKANELQITPLHLACEFNYMKFCENPELNSIDFQRFPVNLNSTLNRTNQLDIVNLLLSHGALLDAKDCDGNVPLIHALIIEKNYCKPNWYYDISYGHLSKPEREHLIKEIQIRLQEIIEILLCHQGNIVACSNNQESVLHILCKYKSLKIPVSTIKLILSKGTNIDAVNNIGLTALHVAITVGNNRMARMLLKLKANVNIKSNDSKIPLHTFFKNAQKETGLFRALLESGSDVNVPLDENNRTLLHVAVEMASDFTIKQLLRYGADINLEDSSGNTCMSFFSYWKDSDDDFSYLDDGDFAEVFQILYTHVQKLLALELYVSKTVQKYCKQYYPHYRACLQESESFILINLDNSYLDCTKELEKMKLRKIDNYTSLYSILRKDSHEISKYVKNKTLIETMKARDLTEDFPLYSYLLKLQFKKGQIRSDLLKSAETSLRNIIGINLPVLCLDLIIKYSKNEDIVNLKATALLKRPLKRKLKDNSCSSKVKSSSKRQKQCNDAQE